MFYIFISILIKLTIAYIFENARHKPVTLPLPHLPRLIFQSPFFFYSLLSAFTVQSSYRMSSQQPKLTTRHAI
jgi:hypothetical protein